MKIMSGKKLYKKIFDLLLARIFKNRYIIVLIIVLSVKVIVSNVEHYFEREILRQYIDFETLDTK